MTDQLNFDYHSGRALLSWEAYKKSQKFVPFVKTAEETCRSVNSLQYQAHSGKAILNQILLSSSLFLLFYVHAKYPKVLKNWDT